eukprot:SAG25_NODE_2768_length_1395_cov_1.699846_2_plen_116_part_00
MNRVVLTGAPLPNTRHGGGVSFNLTEGNVGMTGGSGQCCTDCTASPGCVGWVMVGDTCTLLASITGKDTETCPDATQHPSGAACLSGTRGVMPTYTTLPQVTACLPPRPPRPLAP